MIPLIIGIIRIKKFSKAEKILFALLCISMLSEIMIFILFKYRLNNLFVSRVQGMAEFILLSFFFNYVFSEQNISSVRALIIKILIFVFIGVAIFDLYVNGFNSMDNISLTTECILLMVYSVLAFFHLIQRPVFDNILKAPLFWFNTAILTYFSGNLFLFIFSNYIENHFSKVSPALWGIHSLLNIAFYILITIGFWRTEPKQI
jgi:hypothetical protein